MSTCDCNSGCGAPATPPAPAAGAGPEQAVFLIQNMDCPTEEKLIRDRLRPMAGVDSLQFDLMRRELTVGHHLPSIAPLVAALTALDMAPVVVSSTQDAGASAQAQPKGQGRAAGTLPFGLPRWLPLAVSGLAALGAEGVAWGTGREHGWPVLALPSRPSHAVALAR